MFSPLLEKKTELEPADSHASTAKPKPPLTQDDLINLKNPKVLIVGAGIGGLMLGNFLQKGGIDFLILERAKEVKPLGSALSLGSTFRCLFEQLGILDDLEQIGKLNIGLEFLNQDLSTAFNLDTSLREEMSNAKEYLVSRPDLYDLLWRQIPKEKIHMNKKVISMKQNDEGVAIRCSDNTSYHGDILVGADGAHSAVREQLFKDLKKQSRLPTSDDVPLPFTSVCIVGQTEILDPDEFPDLNLPHSKFNTILGENQYSWVRATTKKNTVCWIAVQFLNEEMSKQHDSFRNSEWGPGAAEAMCKEVRDFKVPGGKDGKVTTMGDLIDRTPKHLISKVMLEEKVFDTWYGGRTVLLGDACHKLNPAGGVGALNTIQDAVALANWIVSLQSKKVSDLENCFKEYHAERFPVVKEGFETSRMMTHVGGKTFTAKVMRTFFKYMPQFIFKQLLAQMSAHRPQLSFLPLVEDKGSVPPAYQASLHKTLAILEKANDAKRVDAQHTSI
ncbi:hypothetical protein MVEG_08261 [Podila verticillata NRRL 6337]|nr:hypothetical protein MVEG_08261 [Podila verticillata NRRL 6337]